MIVTNNHIKLLNRMIVRWDDCEYGAPEIDPKRPYGNSSVELDICEILEWEYDSENRDLINKCFDIHKETEEIISLILSNITLKNIKDMGIETENKEMELFKQYSKEKDVYENAYSIYGSELAGFVSFEKWKEKRKEKYE